MENKNAYLGDGVYIKNNGEELILMTGSCDHPDNTIYLDDEVLQGFIHFVEKVKGIRVEIIKL